MWEGGALKHRVLWRKVASGDGAGDRQWQKLWIRLAQSGSTDAVSSRSMAERACTQWATWWRTGCSGAGYHQWGQEVAAMAGRELPRTRTETKMWRREGLIAEGNREGLEVACPMRRCTAMWHARCTSRAPQCLPAQVDCSSEIWNSFKVKPNSNWFETETLDKMSSHARKNSNKIWICRELNKEQLFLLALYKIRNGIWIKIQRTYMNWIWLKFEFYVVGNFRIW
jgi:hypothetical protein